VPESVFSRASFKVAPSLPDATVKQRASCRGSLVRRTTRVLGVPVVRRTRLTRQSVSSDDVTASEPEIS
jgi:hypothetical protein